MKRRITFLAVCIAIVMLVCYACDDRPAGVPDEALRADIPVSALDFEEDGWHLTSFCYSGLRDEFEVEVSYPDTFEFVECNYQTGAEPVNCFSHPDEFKCLCQGIDAHASTLTVILTRGPFEVPGQHEFTIADILPETCMGDPNTWMVWVSCDPPASGPLTATFKVPEDYDVVSCDAVDQDGVSYACELGMRSDGSEELCTCSNLPRTTTELSPVISLSDGTSVQADIPAMEERIWYACMRMEPTPTAEPTIGGGQPSGGGAQPGGGQPPAGGGGQQPPDCSTYLTYDECKASQVCSWWPDNTCHAEPQPDCSSFTTKDTCSAYSWCTWDPDASTCK